MAKSTAMVRNETDVKAAELALISPEFARAALHVSRSNGAQFLKAAEELANGSVATATELLDRLRNSEAVTAAVQSLSLAKDKVLALFAKLKDLAEFLVPVVGGIVVFAFGYFAAAQLGTLLSILLMCAGVWFAAQGGMAWIAGKTDQKLRFD